MKPFVSIVIPSLGSRKNIARLLKSIANQEISMPKIEVLLILNGVDIDFRDELKRELGEMPFRLILEVIGIRNVNVARNRGVDLAQGDLILFLDDDCALEGGRFLLSHFQAHELRPKVFALGGGYALPDHSGFFDKVYNYLQMRWLTLGSLAGPARFLLGGNFSVKTSILRSQTLRFDEKIAYGGSEFEFFVNAEQAGLQMESTMPDVVHFTQETFKSLTRKNYLQGRGGSIIDFKYPNRKALGGKSITDPAQPFLYNLMFLYCNYVFWAGYHSEQGKWYRILFRIVGDIGRAANFYRYEILKKIARRIYEKDQS